MYFLHNAVKNRYKIMMNIDTHKSSIYIWNIKHREVVKSTNWTY